MRPKSTTGLILLVTLLGVLPAQAAILYTVTPIPVPGATYVAGEEVNDLGVVAGGFF